MAMIWLPTVLGFAFRGEYMFLGGGIGFAITKHLTALLGNFGTGALIVFGLGAFVTFTFNPNFSWVTDLMARLTAKTEKVLADEADEEIALSAADLRMRNKVKEVFAEEEIVRLKAKMKTRRLRRSTKSPPLLKLWRTKLKNRWPWSWRPRRWR